jgi:hypothetical protein
MFATERGIVLMPEREHRLMSAPVSVSQGLRHADARTWRMLGLTLVGSLVIVALLNLFVPKSKVNWPASPAATKAGAGAVEPRTFDVVPRRQSKPSE